MPPTDPIESDLRSGRLLGELRQTRPFRSLEQEAVLALLRTSDLIRNRFAALFEPEDVTLQQYNVLRILRGAGPAGLPTLEIGSRMIERTPGVTRIVDRLEAKGWVERERCREDRRRVWCRITPDELDLLSRLDGPVDRADSSTFDSLAPGDLEELVRILDHLRIQLAPNEDAPVSPDPEP